MTQEEWLALNNGRLLGTNILPPQTDEEIAAWIDERKKRFPARATAAAREAAKKEKEEKLRKEDREHAKMKREMRMEEAEEVEAKRKAQEERRARLRMEKEAEVEARKERDDGRGEGGEGEEESEDDGPPEEVKNQDARTVFRDDRKKKPASQRVCKDFLKGRCRRGPRCPWKHDTKEKPDKAQAGGKERKSLYQRVCDGPGDFGGTLLILL